jgi:hypothetical protein
VGASDDWGREEHVTDLLGGDFELVFVASESVFVAESGEAAWQFLLSSVGPLKMLSESLEPERRDLLRREFVALHERYRVNGEIRMPRECVLILGRRR